MRELHWYFDTWINVSILSSPKSQTNIHCEKTQPCTKEILLFTPKEMQDIYLLQSVIVGGKHDFLLIQIVATNMT